MNDTTVRAQFEAWARPDSVQIQRHHETGEYTERGMSAAWSAWQAAVKAEREKLMREVESLHMAQATNNQNHPSAWHDGVDAAIEAMREAERWRERSRAQRLTTKSGLFSASARRKC